MLSALSSTIVAAGSGSSSFSSGTDSVSGAGAGTSSGADSCTSGSGSAAVSADSAFSAAVLSETAASTGCGTVFCPDERAVLTMTISFAGSSSSSSFFLVSFSMISLILILTFSESSLAFRSLPNAFSRSGRYSSDTLAFGLRDSSPAPFPFRKSTSVCNPILNCFVSLLSLISAIY